MIVADMDKGGERSDHSPMLSVCLMYIIYGMLTNLIMHCSNVCGFNIIVLLVCA